MLRGGGPASGTRDGGGASRCSPSVPGGGNAAEPAGVGMGPDAGPGAGTGTAGGRSGTPGRAGGAGGCCATLRPASTHAAARMTPTTLRSSARTARVWRSAGGTSYSCSGLPPASGVSYQAIRSVW